MAYFPYPASQRRVLLGRTHWPCHLPPRLQSWIHGPSTTTSWFEHGKRGSASPRRPTGRLSLIPLPFSKGRCNTSGSCCQRGHWGTGAGGNASAAGRLCEPRRRRRCVGAHSGTGVGRHSASRQGRDPVVDRLALRHDRDGVGRRQRHHQPEPRLCRSAVTDPCAVGVGFITLLDDRRRPRGHADCNRGSIPHDGCCARRGKRNLQLEPRLRRFPAATARPVDRGGLLYGAGVRWVRRVAGRSSRPSRPSRAAK